MNENYLTEFKPTRFDEFINNFDKELVYNLIKELPNEEGKVTCSKRMVYREAIEIESAEFRVVFLINKGQWFKETVAFSIYSDSNIDFILVNKGFEKDKKLFKKNDIKAISDFIANQIKKDRVLVNIKNIILKMN